MDPIELDPASHMTAVQNVNANGMQDRISVEKAEADGKVLFPLQGIDEQWINFLNLLLTSALCNMMVY